MLIREIMTSPVITVSPDTSIQEVARLMRDRHISGVPVVSADHRLLGMITEVDLIARHAPAHEPHYFTLLSAVIPLGIDEYTRYKEQVRQILAVNAEQLMTRKPSTVRPQDTLEHAAGLMVKPGHNSLPVVEEGRLVGIITRTDLVRMIEQLEVGDQ